MAHNLFQRYAWLVDTISRYGRITLKELSDLWQESPLSNGRPLPQRTFHTYRAAAEEMFDVNINCDTSTYEYYIEGQPNSNERRLQQWLLNSMSINDMVRHSMDMSRRIVPENVPSAREHLPTVVDAMRNNHRIRFTYRAYTRTQPERAVVIEPYFVKLFRQLWYVIGRNVKDEKIKTYALDRMSELTMLTHTFEMSAGISPDTFFADCYGITTSQGEAKDIVLRVEPRQAKYFRALPLHPSQQEVVHDNYSIFTYRMFNTYDLRQAILSYGSNVEVLQPPELRTMIREELQHSLDAYR